MWWTFVGLLGQALLEHTPTELLLAHSMDHPGLAFKTTGVPDMAGQFTCYYTYPDDYLIGELQVRRAGYALHTATQAFALPEGVLVDYALGGHCLLEQLVQDVAAWVLCESGLD